jgi:hypothetical protein
MLFHHDPLHSDDFLDEFRDTAADQWERLGGDRELLGLATERLELEVQAPEPVPAPARA